MMAMMREPKAKVPRWYLHTIPFRPMRRQAALILTNEETSCPHSGQWEDKLLTFWTMRRQPAHILTNEKTSCWEGWACRPECPPKAGKFGNGVHTDPNVHLKLASMGRVGTGQWACRPEFPPKAGEYGKCGHADLNVLQKLASLGRLGMQTWISSKSWRVWEGWACRPECPPKAGEYGKGGHILILVHGPVPRGKGTWCVFRIF